MDQAEIEPTVEDLDLSMTQQPTVFFIPYGLAVILGVGTFVIGTKFHTWKVIFITPGVWTLAAVWVKYDHNALRVLHTKVRLLRVWLTAYGWGGWSVSLPKPQRGGAPDAA